MRIVALSDTHGQHHKADVPDGDLLIFAGDMTLSGDVEDVRSFNSWLGTLPHRYKLVTPGNHDSCLLSPANHKLITNAQLVIDSLVTIEGLRIYMSPAARRFSDRAAFSLESAAQARAHWSLVPRDLDILVTHGPPQGILDIDEYVTKYHPQGCPILRDTVEIIKPRIHFFGHIHRSAGARRGKHTMFYNVSICCDSDHELFANLARVLSDADPL